MAPGKQDAEGLASLVSRMADGLGRLLAQHLALAKLELAEDARAMGGDLGKVAAFIPFVLIGYALLCSALGVYLAEWLGLAGGLLAVGGANLIGGGLGAYLAVNRLRTRQLLAGTVSEITRSKDLIAAAKPDTSLERGNAQRQ
jgi:hypothetical protein